MTTDSYLWPETDRNLQLQIRRLPNVVPVLGADGKPMIDADGKRVTKTTGYSWLVTVPISVSGKRRERYQFRTEDKAKLKAEEISRDKAKLGEAAFALKPAQRQEAVSSYLAGQKLIPDGHSMLGILTDAASAVAVLKGRNVTLEAVAKFYVDRQPKQDKTVPDVVSEFIALRTKRTKKGSPASAKYLADLNRLEKFATDFQCPIVEVTPTQIDAWTDKKKLAGRTRFNYLRLIRTLFRYAQSKEYFPRTVNAMEGVDGVDGYQDDSAIEIFSPAELRKFLEHARPELVPFLVIGAFAGLRHAEIARLDWSEIKAKYIEVTAGKAKTRSRRLVPIQPCLAEWLAPYRRESGPVVPFASMGKQILWLAEDAAVPWKHNALRHSCISYRMAATNDENTVAAESGNSPKMIHKNYRELVLAETAVEWFAIVPAKTDSNIIPMAASQ